MVSTSQGEFTKQVEAKFRYTLGYEPHSWRVHHESLLFTCRLTTSRGNVGGSFLALLIPNYIVQSARGFCIQAPKAHDPQRACVAGESLLLGTDPDLILFSLPPTFCSGTQ